MIKKILANNYLLILLFLGTVALTSCGGDDPKVETFQFDMLEDTTLLSTLEPEAIENIVLLTGMNQLQGIAKYKMHIYKVTYQTTYNGKDILASGLICYPEGTPEPAPIMSAQHGTIANDSKAPSNFSLINRQYTMMEFFATAGYITFIPDYIGYNASTDILHPYYNYENQSQAVKDLIVAGQEFLLAKEIAFKDDLYLFGYSEGGYTTMAAHKAIENEPGFGLNIVANASGAGGYDINGVMDHIIANDTYGAPALIAYVIHSFNQTLDDWQHPSSYFFKEPYASQMEGLFDGSKTIGEINAALTPELNKLFQDDILAELRSGEDNKIRQAFKANSVHEWASIAPIRMYHSKEDEIIPFNNSYTSYESMVESGAQDIEFVSIEEGSHGGAVPTMVIDAISWFEQVNAETVQ